MEQKDLVAAAKDELQLVLGFFGRVESKASVVLALNTGIDEGQNDNWFY
jgi:hypothetical protein